MGHGLDFLQTQKIKQLTLSTIRKGRKKMSEGRELRQRCSACQAFIMWNSLNLRSEWNAENNNNANEKI